MIHPNPMKAPGGQQLSVRKYSTQKT